MLDLGGTDPEGQRPKGAVGRGVAVTADERCPGESEALKPHFGHNIGLQVGSNQHPMKHGRQVEHTPRRVQGGRELMVRGKRVENHAEPARGQ